MQYYTGKFKPDVTSVAVEDKWSQSVQAFDVALAVGVEGVPEVARTASEAGVLAELPVSPAEGPLALVVELEEQAGPAVEDHNCFGAVAVAGLAPQAWVVRKCLLALMEGVLVLVDRRFERELLAAYVVAVE